MGSLSDAFAETDAVSASIAGAALLVSFVALWWQHAAAGRSNFTVDWAGVDHLVVVNHGPGPAKNVTARLTELRLVDEGSPAYLPPGQVWRIYAARRLSAPLGELELSWQDNRWRRQKMTVAVPSPPSHRSTGSARSDREEVVRSLAQEEARHEVDEFDRRLGRGWR